MKIDELKPRNDYVLIKVVQLDRIIGSKLIAPHISQGGKEYIIQRVGHKVENLSRGDKVQVIGEEGLDWAFLPNSNELFLTKEQNVVLITGHTEEE